MKVLRATAVLSLMGLLNTCIASPPLDWAPRISAKQMLYAEDETSGAFLFPLMANGYVSHTINDDKIVVSGVFNGESTSPSHRARIPAPHSFWLHAEDPTKQTEILLGSGLDLEYGTYYRRGEIQNINTGSQVMYEQRFYAHRKFRSLMVVEVDFFYFPGEKIADPVLLTVISSEGEPSEDIKWHERYEMFASTSVRIQNGSCISPEVQGQPPTQVAVISTPLPTSLCIVRNYSFIFVTAVRSSIDSEDPVTSAIQDFQQGTEVWKQGVLHDFHVDAWRELWEAGYEIVGRDDVALAVNASIFAILSSVRDDYPLGLSPGGINNAYSGHSFWDVETWMYPAVLMWHPSIAASLIDYRYDRLDAAYAKAKSYNPPFNGAMFPWESAYTGVETTLPTFGMGEREQHISGDIAFAVWQYYRATRNDTWLKLTGYPILKGVADFWVSKVEVDVNEVGHIHDVIPPDEYADHVSDSVFTNAVAIMSLDFALKTSQILGEQPGEKWASIRDSIIIIFDEKRQFHPEFEGYTGEKIKQADAILLGFPLGLNMTGDVWGNDLRYYEQRTDENGPAMTWGMHSIGHIQLDEKEEAAKLFNRSFAYIQPPFGVWSETVTGQGATNFITGAGGFLQTVIFGWPRLRLEDDGISINPTCPENAKSWKLRKLAYLGSALSISHFCAEGSTIIGLVSAGKVGLTLVRPYQQPTNLIIGKSIQFPAGPARIVASSKYSSLRGSR